MIRGLVLGASRPALPGADGTEKSQDRLVEDAVAGQGVAAVRAVLPVERGESSARLPDDHVEGSHVVELEVRLGKKESDLSEYVGQLQNQMERRESDWWEKQLGQPVADAKGQSPRQR